MKPLAVLCWAVATLVAAADVAAQDSFTLTYGFQKGKTYRMREIRSGNSMQEMMGQEMKSTGSGYTVTRLVVDEVAGDGSLVMTMAPDSMMFSVKSVRMDTTMVIEEMIGKRIRITVSKLGAITKREVIDSVQVQGMIRRTMAQRESFKLRVLPEKPVAVGTAWHSAVTDSIEGMGGYTLTSTELDFQVAGKEPALGTSVLKITYSGTTTVKGKGKMMGADFFTEGNGTLKGTLFFDAVRGLPLKDEFSFERESTAVITGEQTMTIPGSESGTVTRLLLPD